MSRGESKADSLPTAWWTAKTPSSKTAGLIEQYTIQDPAPWCRSSRAVFAVPRHNRTDETIAKLAREYGVHLHTHLAETKMRNNSACKSFVIAPSVMQEVGLVGGDVWFAHAVWVNDEEIKVFAEHNCGVAHCPSSNMRLASGIAPIKQYRQAGVNVGLGVDGSASNDGSHLLAGSAMRCCCRVSKKGHWFFRQPSPSPGGEGLGARSEIDDRQEALYLARAAARLFLEETTSLLEPGKCADFLR